MRGEPSRLRVEARVTRGRFGFFRDALERSMTIADTDPHDSRARRVRECAQCVELDVECIAKTGAAKLLDQTISHRGLGASEKPESKMPVRRGSRLAWQRG